MTAVLVPLVLAWVDRPGPGQLPAADGPHQQATLETVPQWTRGAAMLSWRFWSVTAPFALAFTSQVGFIVHQVAFLSPSLGRSGAGTAVAIMTTMAVVGRLLLGTVVDRLDQRLASAASLRSQAAALLVMTLTESSAALYLACAVYGLSVGNIITFPPLIVQREFDAASYGMLVGLSTAVGQLISSLGPVLVGVVRDVSGSYAVGSFGLYRAQPRGHRPDPDATEKAAGVGRRLRRRGPDATCWRADLSRWNEVMGAETQADVEAIKQSIGLLRRHL